KGCKWIGENGWIWVTRGKYDASNPEWVAEGFDPGEIQVYKSPGHQRDFINCVKSRKESVAPAENAHRAITPGHLAYVSHELGRALKWDPKAEKVIGDESAHSKLVELPFRGDWKI
ncbi:MAG: gfo/Idh/MocA family oxidoreductase, partial [Verrucomicrobiota bacterium]